MADDDGTVESQDFVLKTQRFAESLSHSQSYSFHMYFLRPYYMPGL